MVRGRTGNKGAASAKVQGCWEDHCVLPEVRALPPCAAVVAWPGCMTEAWAPLSPADCYGVALPVDKASWKCDRCSVQATSVVSASLLRLWQISGAAPCLSTRMPRGKAWGAPGSCVSPAFLLPCPGAGVLPVLPARGGPEGDDSRPLGAPAVCPAGARGDPGGHAHPLARRRAGGDAAAGTPGECCCCCWGRRARVRALPTGLWAAGRSVFRCRHYLNREAVVG